MELVPFAQGAAGAPGKVKKDKSYKLQAASNKLDKLQAVGYNRIC